jgi:hypothetical protein
MKTVFKKENCYPENTTEAIAESALGAQKEIIVNSSKIKTI